MNTNGVIIDNIKDFDCNKNTIIEASAGTGKTYTIAQIVPFLLTQKDKDGKYKYSLNDILIVTYTTKATGELRDRIRRGLIDVKDKLPQDLQDKINQEIEIIDDAPIFTINSFCQKTLNENATYANCTQNMTLVDEGAEFETFIGKYIRDILVNDKVFMYLYECTKDFQYIIQDAINKYYLDKNGKPDADVISLDVLSDDEEAQYAQMVQELDTTNKITETKCDNIPAFLMRCFVIKNIDCIYLAWHKYKADKNIQTYNDMIKIVHDAISKPSPAAPDPILLQELKQKYKYAIIDEFQDTNQLQWNIFKQIFTTDDDHHIAIVGDPKQSIYSFHGADSKVYNIAKEYIQSHGGDVKTLKTNYRSSVTMIKAINVLARDNDVCFYSDQEYQDAEIPSVQGNQILPAQLNGKDIEPVHIVNVPAETTIVSKIFEYCTSDKNGKTALQIWDKHHKCYRNVTFDDFAILVRNRKHALKMTDKLKESGIPFMWHKDSTLFASKEAADWIAILSAIQASDFNSQKRDILRQALQTEFFNVGLEKVNDEKFDDILCRERQILLKWHNLAENKQYSILMNSIFEDSGIAKRLANYTKIQSLSKYTQICDFVFDYLASGRGSVASAIKALKQQKNKQKDTEEKISVEKATGVPTVKIITVHSAKGLEYPIVFYFINPIKKSDTEPNFVRIDHTNGTVLNIEMRNTDPKEPDLQSLNYVAITRAGSLMFLINTKKQKNSKNFTVPYPKQLVDAYPDLFVMEDSLDSDLPVLYASGKTYDSDDVKEKCTPINLTQKRLYKHSYTSLSHHAKDGDEDTNILITETTERINKEEDTEPTDKYSIQPYDSKIVEIGRNMYNPTHLAPVSLDACGKQYGTTIHEIFERIDFTKFQNDEYKEYLNQIISRHPVARSYDRDSIINLVVNTMSAEFPEIVGNQDTGNKFKLNSLPSENKRAEIEFNLNPDTAKPLMNYCNGFIDLLFMRKIDNKNVFSILDWKTDLFKNENGEVVCENYANYDYLKSHTDDSYAIQRTLYAYCLVKWLKQFYPKMSESDIFENHFGGMYYVYVRGCNNGTSNGIYAHTWPDYQSLKDEFDNIITKGIYHG